MSEEYKHVVRVAGYDIDGSLKVVAGLARIKGVGLNLGYVVCRLAGVDHEQRIGDLPAHSVKKLEDVLADLGKYQVPWWLMNRARDPKTNKDLHLIGSDLELTVKSDVDLMKKIKCWKGLRHAWGLKVRGQRTRTTGRTGQTVGVTKKPT
ncbi:MAG: 30S ribosomal protein S13 [Candidatus Nezhaarchaeales archaeon]